MIHRTFAVLAVLFSLSINAAEPIKPPAPDPATVEFQWGLRIPLRDQVQLHASLYRPKGQRDPLPCVFTLTPYIGDTYHERGMYFAANGYVFLNVDVRGRGASEGQFTPMLQEAKDGYDVVEWLAAQPFCNGKVAMWGGSYAGYNQWAVAKEFPPHLSTIVPAASARAGTDFPMFNNIPYQYEIQWMTFTSGRAVQSKMFGDSKFWEAKYRELYMQHRPFSELDRVTGNLTTRFSEWIAHPMVDSYWDSYNATPEQLARLDLPILTITGHYDGDQAGALAWYKEHMQQASKQARERHFLIIGPWDHAGTRTPKAEVGGLKFGEASLLDLNALHKQWYDWTMKSGARPDFLKAPVAYYVTVADRWRYAPSLDAVTARREPLYLQGAADTGDVFDSGQLAAKPPKATQKSRYAYDPLDTAPGKDEAQSDANLVDQSAVLRNPTRALIYHSAPFEQDTELSGFFSLSAWIALDQPDTDFRAEVYEILADGSSVSLSNDQMRARYRESLRAEKLIPKNEILRYDFKGFTFISRLVKKGSRLRLVFGPINSIYSQKNYNSGGVVAQESAKDARTVTVTLYQGSKHPSALYLPIAAKE